MNVFQFFLFLPDFWKYTIFNLAEVFVDFSLHSEKSLRQREQEVQDSIAYTSDFATFLILFWGCKFSQILIFFSHKSSLYSKINSISASGGEKNHCCAARWMWALNVHSLITLPITACSQFPAHTKTFSEEKSPHLLHEQVWQGLKLDCWIPEVSSLLPQQCKGRNAVMLEFILKSKWSILKNGD